MRRFFWGNSLAQALMTAARHHGIAPEQLAYRVHEKRHGFVKHARNVVIEVDPEVPRRPAGESAPERSLETAPKSAPGIPAGGTAPARTGGGAPEAGRTPEGEPRRRESRPDQGGSDTGRGGRRRRGGERAGGGRGGHEVWSDPDEESLVAIAEAVRAIVALGGLDLEVSVRPGEGRVDVELSGASVEVVRERGLALLEEMELLAPRAAHGLSGKMVRCRVDCGGLRAEREEALRELARREAAAVAESGEASYTEPLTAGDRRIIHLELAESTEVETESVGEGLEKRVRIAPRVDPT